MKTLAEIINFVENLKNEYKTEMEHSLWHVSISIGSVSETTCFFIDNKKETIEIRANIIAELGKPDEKETFEKIEHSEAFTVYRYINIKK